MTTIHITTPGRRARAGRLGALAAAAALCLPVAALPGAASAQSTDGTVTGRAVIVPAGTAADGQTAQPFDQGSDHFQVSCGTAYRWWGRVTEDPSFALHIQMDVQGHFVGCSGQVYVDTLTPTCAGAGQCLQPQTGTIDQGGSRANPWDNQYVYFFNGNATGFYYLRFSMDSYGNYSWNSGAG